VGFFVIFTPIQIFNRSKLSLPTMLYKSRFNASVILCFPVKLNFGTNSDGISRGDLRGKKAAQIGCASPEPSVFKKEGKNQGEV